MVTGTGNSRPTGSGQQVKPLSPNIKLYTFSISQLGFAKISSRFSSFSGMRHSGGEEVVLPNLAPAT